MSVLQPQQAGWQYRVIVAMFGVEKEHRGGYRDSI
jgi:hypothetical protein